MESVTFWAVSSATADLLIAACETKRQASTFEIISGRFSYEVPAFALDDDSACAIKMPSHLQSHGPRGDEKTEPYTLVLEVGLLPITTPT